MSIRFDLYCQSCANANKSASDLPCRNCLAYGYNTDLIKPICWSEKYEIFNGLREIDRDNSFLIGAGNLPNVCFRFKNEYMVTIIYNEPKGFAVSFFEPKGPCSYHLDKTFYSKSIEYINDFLEAVNSLI